MVKLMYAANMWIEIQNHPPWFQLQSVRADEISLVIYCICNCKLPLCLHLVSGAVCCRSGCRCWEAFRAVRMNRENGWTRRVFWRENVSLAQDEMKEKAKLEEEKKDEEKEDPKGIPEFWLTVFKNVDLLSDMLQVGRPRPDVSWRARENGSHAFWLQLWNKLRVCFHLLGKGVNCKILKQKYIVSLCVVSDLMLWCCLSSPGTRWTHP